MTDLIQPDQWQEAVVRLLVVPEVVRLPAEIDIVNSETVGGELFAAFKPGVAVVIADMRATTFCDSTGIYWLVMAHNNAACTGTELRVVNSSRPVRRAMFILGADQILHLYPNMTSALTGLPYIH